MAEVVSEAVMLEDSGTMAMVGGGYRISLLLALLFLSLLFVPSLLFFIGRHNAFYSSSLYRTRDCSKSPTTRIELLGLLFKSRRLLSPCERMSSRMAESCTSAHRPGARLLVLLHQSCRLLSLCQAMFGYLAESCSLTEEC